MSLSVTFKEIKTHIHESSLREKKHLFLLEAIKTISQGMNKMSLFDKSEKFTNILKYPEEINHF